MCSNYREIQYWQYFGSGSASCHHAMMFVTSEVAEAAPIGLVGGIGILRAHSGSLRRVGHEGAGRCEVGTSAAAAGEKKKNKRGENDMASQNKAP